MKAAISLLALYRSLLEDYGPQGWWPADSPFEVMVGAVLTQNTAWRNVERAIAGLRETCDMTPQGLLSTPTERLQQLIRPSGYFRLKSERLRELCRFLVDACEGRLCRLGKVPTAKLRERFLTLNGIGPETADSMLLYALGRPVFVVDAYTVRLLARLGILSGDETYGEAQALFLENLETDAELFKEYHALIVAHGKERCRRRDPLCVECPLAQRCAFGPGSGIRDSNYGRHRSLRH